MISASRRFLVGHRRMSSLVRKKGCRRRCVSVSYSHRRTVYRRVTVTLEVAALFGTRQGLNSARPLAAFGGAATMPPRVLGAQRSENATESGPFLTTEFFIAESFGRRCFYGVILAPYAAGYGWQKLCTTGTGSNASGLSTI
jgi:hypothetical protein